MAPDEIILTKISEATTAVPRRTDLVPMARPGDGTPYHVPVGNFTWGWGDVHAYGAVGDGVADDATAITIAITTLAVMQPGVGQTRHGRVHLMLDPSKMYAIESPIGVCDLQGVVIDGGAPGMGATIWGKCAGKAMFEIIGSQDIELRNLQLWGDQDLSPAVGTWTARSTSPSGTVSANIRFTNMHYYGYYNNACHYCIGSESNIFRDCWTYPYGNTGMELVHVTTLNDFSLTPVHTTLASTTYGNWGMSFYECGLTSGPGYTCVAIHDFCNVNLHSTYLYSVTNPSVLLYGGTVLLDIVGVEGTPDNTIEVRQKPGGGYNFFTIHLHDVGLGTPNNYSIYCADSMIMCNSKFTGFVSPGLSGGTFKPIRFYRAEGCDFSGTHGHSGGIPWVIDGGYALDCKWHLNEYDTFTELNGAYHTSCMIENNSGGYNNGYLEYNGGFRPYRGAASKTLADIRTASFTWDIPSTAPGGKQTSGVDMTDVAMDGKWFALAFMPELTYLSGGSGAILYPRLAAAYCYVDFINMSGNTLDPASGTVYVLCFKIV